MIYRIQNRYQDSGWQDTDEQFNCVVQAVNRAWILAADAVRNGMVRVVGEDRVIVTFGAGENRDDQPAPVATPAIYIPSPNGAEPGSLVHAAEQWMLKNGMTIPTAGKFRHLFQGMLDDFQESDDYDIWERS